MTIERGILVQSVIEWINMAHILEWTTYKSWKKSLTPSRNRNPVKIPIVSLSQIPAESSQSEKEHL